MDKLFGLVGLGIWGVFVYVYTDGMSSQQQFYFLLSNLLLLVLVVPFWKMLPRYGYPAPLALITLIPVTVPILLWIVAFSSPVQNKEAN